MKRRFSFTFFCKLQRVHIFSPSSKKRGTLIQDLGVSSRTSVVIRKVMHRLEHKHENIWRKTSHAQFSFGHWLHFVRRQFINISGGWYLKIRIDKWRMQLNMTNPYLALKDNFFVRNSLHVGCTLELSKRLAENQTRDLRGWHKDYFLLPMGHFLKDIHSTDICTMAESGDIDVAHMSPGQKLYRPMANI